MKCRPPHINPGFDISPERRAWLRRKHRNREKKTGKAETTQQEQKGGPDE